MSQTISSSNKNNTPNPNSRLFDLRQRADGAWVVWTRKSPAELGLVNRSSVEAARGAAFNDADWSAFLHQAHFTEQSVWVAAQVYASRPPVDTVLALLGVKRANRPSQPRNRNVSQTAPKDQTQAA